MRSVQIGSNDYLVNPVALSKMGEARSWKPASASTARCRCSDARNDVWEVDADSELDKDGIARNVFELYDAEGDDTISETEWMAGTDRCYPERAEVQVFDDVDGDGDSEIDGDELAERLDVTPLGE